jgi:hypothetical protein
MLTAPLMRERWKMPRDHPILVHYKMLKDPPMCETWTMPRDHLILVHY